MNGIKHYCEPRPDLLTGTFNPEIFVPSLADVLNLYRRDSEKRAGEKTIYTDAESFFREGTFPSERLVNLVREVLRRLQGDHSFSSTQRIDTSFGGGKTHSLIALAHLSQRGKELQEAVSGWCTADLLPEAGEIQLVGIVGEEATITAYEGDTPEAWPLWREIAYQLDPVLAEESWARSKESPERGGPWFRNVLEGRKVLLLLDELAVYATRLSAARPQERAQVATFLKTLFDYARAEAGLVTVLTLASEKDAFSEQTQLLQKALANEKGVTEEEISKEEAKEAARESTKDLESVIARDQKSQPILSPADLARVFAKRLFQRIDPAGAEEATRAYEEAYRREEQYLPGEANRPEMRKRMEENYPFHPTFIDFLYGKLSSVENFQGTRGVLQTMSLVIHRLWSETDRDPLMIQVPDIDLRGGRIIDMLLGRTKALDLQPALTTDVCGESNKESHAQTLDFENPNPAEPRWHEKVWLTVFLNSLAGRTQGLESKIFGITETEACFQCAHPDLSPTLVVKALEDIKEYAWYLKVREGRYFCDLEPTIARIVRSLRENLRGSDGSEKVHREIVSHTRRLLKNHPPFKIYAEKVSRPEDLPDEQEQPTVVVVDHNAEEISLQDFYTGTGRGPRSHQNPLIFLVPDSVLVREENGGQADLFEKKQARVAELMNRARDVLARRQIKEQPEKHQLSKRVLEEEDFENELKVKESELRSQVAKLYSTFWYPAYQSGELTAYAHNGVAAESGLDIFPGLEKRLKDRSKLLTNDSLQVSQTLTHAGSLFFARASLSRLKDLAERFYRDRTWPMLASPELFAALIRSGIEKKQWVVIFRQRENEPPEAVYSDKNPLPLTVTPKQLAEDEGYWIVQVEEARKKGWLEEKPAFEPRKILEEVVSPAVPAKVSDFRSAVEKKIPEELRTPERAQEVLREGLETGKIVVLQGDLEKEGAKPSTVVQQPRDLTPEILSGEDTVVAKRELAERKGWLAQQTKTDTLTLGESAFPKIHPQLKGFGRFSRGMKGKLTLTMEQVKLRGSDVRIDLLLTEADAEAVGEAEEILEVFAAHTEPDENATFHLELTEAKDCPFAKKLKEVADA